MELHMLAVVAVEQQLVLVLRVLAVQVAAVLEE
jgi:hypothetical protein